MAKQISDIASSAAAIAKLGQTLVDAAEAIAIIDDKEAYVASLEKRAKEAESKVKAQKESLDAGVAGVEAAKKEAAGIVSKAQADAADVLAKAQKDAAGILAAAKVAADEAAAKEKALLEKCAEHEAAHAKHAGRIADAEKQEAVILGRIKALRDKAIKDLSA
jgi:hypothetical protein